MSNETLEKIGRDIVFNYDSRLLFKAAPVPIEEIMEQVYGLTLEFHYISKNGRVLGETVFEDSHISVYERRNNEGYKLIPVKARTVIIDASLLSSSKAGRLRFTCAHELAHWVLDKEHFTKIGETAAMSDVSLGRIETRADRLASCILMPRCILKKTFYAVRSEENDFNKIAASLTDIFGVSRQAMNIRLKQLGLEF